MPINDDQPVDREQPSGARMERSLRKRGFQTDRKPYDGGQGPEGRPDQADDPRMLGFVAVKAGGVDEDEGRHPFRTPGGDGVITRSGYRFLIWLPAPGGGAARELPARQPTGYVVVDEEGRLIEGVRAGTEGRAPVALTGTADPDLAERLYCAYAWPVAHGESGRRTFFLAPNGDILATDDSSYEGDDGPKPGAAFESGGIDRITGEPARERTGQDGNRWTQVN